MQQGILVIFDVTEQSSFDDIKMWMNQIEQVCNESRKQ